jgi:hypothetical protein
LKIVGVAAVVEGGIGEHAEVEQGHGLCWTAVELELTEQIGMGNAPMEVPLPTTLRLTQILRLFLDGLRIRLLDTATKLAEKSMSEADANCAGPPGRRNLPRWHSQTAIG